MYSYVVVYQTKPYHDAVILTSFLALIMSRSDVLSNEIKEIYFKINEECNN